MESFCFSHYPLSTRRKGKRTFVPDNLEEATSAAIINDVNVGEGTADGMEDPPLAKRLKTDTCGGTTTTIIDPLPPRNNNNNNTPVRPKRGYQYAFGDDEDNNNDDNNNHTIDPNRRHGLATPPPTQRARVVSDSQSAGQVTTESPVKTASSSSLGCHSTMIMNGMNGLLGQLHAERKQRLQNQSQPPPPCPLTLGMHAMSIQTAPSPSHPRRHYYTQLLTDSKLA